MKSKKRQITVADRTMCNHPHFLVVGAKNYIIQIESRIEPNELENIILTTDIEVIIRKVKNSDLR
jgi:hypothetical protein